MSNLPYLPLTAAPFRQNESHLEVPPRNPALARYIRCFWGSSRPYRKKAGDTAVTVVIPDTCVDIIYHIDYTANTITGNFCGVNDTSFVYYEDSAPGHLISTFAVRFYAWGVHAFSEDSLKGTLNGYYDVQSRFRWLDQALRAHLWDVRSLEERSRLAEKIFLRQSAPAKQHNIIDRAINRILTQRGALSAAELAKECFISGRQLERLFHDYVGIPPKKLCNLVRYQYLWNEILRNPRFCVLDAVHTYGYADQSHLMREFKRYHSMDIRTAKIYARQDVGNIQDIPNRFL